MDPRQRGHTRKGKTVPNDVGGYGAGVGRPVRALMVFALAAAVSFVAIDLFIEGGAYLRHFQQSWTSHFGAARSFEYGSAAAHPFDWSIFFKNWDLTIPTCLGVALCLRQRRRSPWLVLPVAWLGLMILVFATHRPWWSYDSCIRIPIIGCSRNARWPGWRDTECHTGFSVLANRDLRQRNMHLDGCLEPVPKA